MEPNPYLYKLPKLLSYFVKTKKEEHKQNISKDQRTFSYEELIRILIENKFSDGLEKANGTSEVVTIDNASSERGYFLDLTSPNSKSERSEKQRKKIYDALIEIFEIKNEDPTTAKFDKFPKQKKGKDLKQEACFLLYTWKNKSIGGVNTYEKQDLDVFLLELKGKKATIKIFKLDKENAIEEKYIQEGNYDEAHTNIFIEVKAKSTANNKIITYRKYLVLYIHPDSSIITDRANYFFGTYSTNLTDAKPASGGCVLKRTNSVNEAKELIKNHLTNKDYLDTNSDRAVIHNYLYQKRIITSNIPIRVEEKEQFPNYSNLEVLLPFQQKFYIGYFINMISDNKGNKGVLKTFIMEIQTGGRIFVRVSTTYPPYHGIAQIIAGDLLMCRYDYNVGDAYFRIRAIYKATPKNNVNYLFGVFNGLPYAKEASRPISGKLLMKEFKPKGVNSIFDFKDDELESLIKEYPLESEAAQKIFKDDPTILEYLLGFEDQILGTRKFGESVDFFADYPKITEEYFTIDRRNNIEENLKNTKWLVYYYGEFSENSTHTYYTNGICRGYMEVDDFGKVNGKILGNIVDEKANFNGYITKKNNPSLHHICLKNEKIEMKINIHLNLGDNPENGIYESHEINTTRFVHGLIVMHKVQYIGDDSIKFFPQYNPENINELTKELTEKKAKELHSYIENLYASRYNEGKAFKLNLQVKPERVTGEKYYKRQYQIFLSTPITSTSNNEIVKDDTKRLIEILKDKFPKWKTYCALFDSKVVGEKGELKKTENNKHVVYDIALTNFKNSERLLIFYHETLNNLKKPSSILIECGWALIQNKPITILRKIGTQLPNMVEGASKNHLVNIIDYMDIEDLLMILNDNSSIFAK